MPMVQFGPKGPWLQMASLKLPPELEKSKKPNVKKGKDDKDQFPKIDFNVEEVEDFLKEIDLEA